MLYLSNDGRIVVLKAAIHANDHIKAMRSNQERLMIQPDFDEPSRAGGRRLSSTTAGEQTPQQWLVVKLWIRCELLTTTTHSSTQVLLRSRRESQKPLQFPRFTDIGDTLLSPMWLYHSRKLSGTAESPSRYQGGIETLLYDTSSLID